MWGVLFIRERDAVRPEASDPEREKREENEGGRERDVDPERGSIGNDCVDVMVRDARKDSLRLVRRGWWGVDKGGVGKVRDKTGWDCDVSKEWDDDDVRWVEGKDFLVSWIEFGAFCE